ncbi:unnamed protein product [Adineta steineri]|uniref:Uncharacterized protein n=1 Tax=Adineta steineri TaxID=433720 RepID=A0A814SWH3_9BILA|nr:unnamed protein product [Adineta steineri]CAF1601248.1 unnamed protein product [Adineta steineri]
MMTMLLGPVKAGFEVICGDEEGASRTMNTFSKINPLVMSLRVTAEVLSGNSDNAKDTIKTFGSNVGNMACSMPLLGHTIAVGYRIAGKDEKARRIFEQATRTTVLAGAGIIGFGAGPEEAAAFAIIAGVGWDLIDIARGKEANGIVKLVEIFSRDKKLTPGEIFDAVMVPITDGMTGYAAANAYGKYTKAREQNQTYHGKSKKQGTKNPEKIANSMCKQAKDLEQMVAANERKLFELEQKFYEHPPPPNAHINGHTSATMIDKDGNQSTGYSRRLTDARGTPRFQSEISKLEQNYPNVKSVLSRPLNACAEHMAFENISNPIIIYAIQIKNGLVFCVKRCENCEQFDLRNVITDSMHGTPVPFLITEVPPPGSYVRAIVSDIILISVANTEREERR